MAHPSKQFTAQRGAETLSTLCCDKQHTLIVYYHHTPKLYKLNKADTATKCKGYGERYYNNLEERPL